MSRTTLAALVTILLLVLAGCAGSAPEATVDPDAADEPRTGQGTGSLTGTVVGDEGLPVGGATVAIVETLERTTTDSNGTFTFNGLEPGSYRVIFERLGFESQGRIIDVAAGEVSQLDVVLVPVRVDTGPYYDAQVYVSHLQADQEWLSFVFILANLNWSAMCGTCIHHVYLEPGPQQVLVENWWEPSGVPGLNEGIMIWWRYYDPDGEFHNALESYANREAREMGDETTELRESGATNLTLSVHSKIDGVSFDHRIETWNTFAYHGDLPAGYTALPPE